MLTLSQEDSKQLASHIVDALIVKLSDEKTVSSISTVWGTQFDTWLGRGLRRFAFYVIVAAVIAGAVKFQAWELLVSK